MLKDNEIHFKNEYLFQFFDDLNESWFTGEMRNPIFLLRSKAVTDVFILFHSNNIFLMAFVEISISYVNRSEGTWIWINKHNHFYNQPKSLAKFPNFDRTKG